MAFEALNTLNGKEITVDDFDYIYEKEQKDQYGVVERDSDNHIKLIPEMTKASKQFYESVKDFLVCTECKGKVRLFNPVCRKDTNTSGYKRPPYFAHSDNNSDPMCVKRTDIAISVISSHSPAIKKPGSESTNRTDKIIKLIQFICDQLPDQYNIEFLKGTGDWEREKRKNQKKEILIRNKDITEIFLAYYRQKLSFLKKLRLRLNNPTEEYLESLDSQIEKASNLLRILPKSRRLRQSHPLMMKHSYIRSGLSRKFPYLNASATEAKNVKMETEITCMLENPNDFFLRRSKNSKQPFKIIEFKDLTDIHFKHKKLLRLVKDFLRLWGNREEKYLENNCFPRKNYFSIQKTLESVTPSYCHVKDSQKLDEDFDCFHIYPCFELIMIIEQSGQDPFEVLTKCFDWLLAQDKTEAPQITIDPSHYQKTGTISKINKEIKLSLFYEYCKDPDLFTTDDKRSFEDAQAIAS